MKQYYEDYTAEDAQVWSILFERQMTLLPTKASVEFLDGVQKVGFEQKRIPNFDEVNRRLRRLTGWELCAVPGIVPNEHFFELLASKKFPATTWLRKMSQLNYLEEPDMFHDVFGHVPLLSNPEFCGFLEGLSRIALSRLHDANLIERISRMYWFTVEFGLILEADALRIYGAGILSSIGETEFCLSAMPSRMAFHVNQILSSPYIIDKFQEKYFVIRSFADLSSSLDKIEKCLEVNPHSTGFNSHNAQSIDFPAVSGPFALDSEE